MTVETSADLASFFDEDEFAEEATYTPSGGGAGIPCVVIVDRGTGRTHFAAGEGRVSSAERLVHVRASELEAARGGQFVIALDDEVLEVTGSPSLDETGAIYTCEVLIRS